MANKILISLSGGADSATCLAMLIKNGYEVEAVGFEYGSKHNDLELMAASKISQHYGIRFDVIDIREIMRHFKSSLLKGQEQIPEGRYDEENMKSTVVPLRNIIFSTILAGIANSRGVEAICLGVHSGDHYIYPDCRENTIESLRETIYLGSGGLVNKILCPILMMDKTQIIETGIRLGVPYELTRTCYTSSSIACGKCGSCRERIEAFEKNGMKDPIQYQ